MRRIFSALAALLPAAALVLSLSNGPAAAGWALVQSKIQAGTGTSVSASITALGAGDLVVVVVGAGASNTLSSVTDNTGDTCTQVPGTLQHTANGSIALYDCPKVSGSATSVTATWSSSTSLAIQVLEFSGYTGQSLDPASGTAASGTSTNPSAGSITTANSGDLIVAGVIGPACSSLSGGSGFTLAACSGSGPGIAAEYQTQSSVGNIAGSFTQSTGSTWEAAVAGFTFNSGAHGLTTHGAG
jgi:hypothetical protein